MSDICTAFNPLNVIGSKVTNARLFVSVLREAIKVHDFAADRIPGQGFIEIPDAIPFVSCGVGRPSSDPNHYVLREHRGHVSAYLKREFAAPAESCAAVVYTEAAYFADPDVTAEETERVKTQVSLSQDIGGHIGEIYVVVAVMASAGPSSSLSAHRFTANLAGGNREAQVCTADEIRAKAREIVDYENKWTTIADISIG